MTEDDRGEPHISRFAVTKATEWRGDHENATLRVADAVIQGHLMSAFSSAEGTQQMLGVRKAIAAALNE